MRGVIGAACANRSGDYWDVYDAVPVAPTGSLLGSPTDCGASSLEVAALKLAAEYLDSGGAAKS